MTGLVYQFAKKDPKFAKKEFAKMKVSTGNWTYHISTTVNVIQLQICICSFHRHYSTEEEITFSRLGTGVFHIRK